MNPKRIHCETFQGGSWSWLQMIRSLACPPWSLGMRCMHIEKAYWQRTGHIRYKSTGGKPQNELQSPKEGFDINPQPLDSSNFKSSPADQVCFFFHRPLVSQTFSYLAQLPWLPLKRLMRRLECVWRSRRNRRQMKAQWAISGFCKSAPCFLPCVHKIPLSTKRGSSIKSLKIFKYQKFCLEVKFQSFDCIWRVCIGKKCQGKAIQYAKLALKMSRKQRTNHLPSRRGTVKQRGGQAASSL